SRAAHRREAVEHLHARALGLDVVEQAELDDVHSELGVLDGAERLDHVVTRRHSRQCSHPSEGLRRPRATRWKSRSARRQPPEPRASVSPDHALPLGKRKLAALAAVGEHYATSIGDRKSTRLNSSHDQTSYAVFCLKKKK